MNLRKISIFEKLSDDEIAKLERVVVKRWYEPDTVILFEGDKSDSMFIINSGTAKVYQTSDEGKERIVSTLASGAIFGEIAMLDGNPRSASVATIERTEMGSIAYKDFRALVSENPEVLWKVLESMCEMVRRMGADMLDMSFRDVPYRLLRTLVTLAEKHGEETPDGVRVAMKLTAESLSGMVGSNRERVSRLLQRFQDEKLIVVDGDRITIRDPRQLERSSEYAQDWG